MALLDELSELIENWLNERRGHSLTVLSKRSGVSYPTVRRIHQKEHEPNLNNVLNILSVVTSVEASKMFLQKHYPELAPYIEKSLVEFVPMDGLAEVERFTLYDFLVIGLASTKNGVSEEELVSKAGEFGIKALRKLRDAGVVEAFEDRFVTIAKNVRTVGSDRILQSISLLCDAFDYERIDSRGSLFRLKTEGLAKEAVLEIYKLLYELSEKVQTIMDNPKNHGEYVLGVGVVSTFLQFPKGEPNL